MSVPKIIMTDNGSANVSRLQRQKLTPAQLLKVAVDGNFESYRQPIQAVRDAGICNPSLN